MIINHLAGTEENAAPLAQTTSEVDMVATSHDVMPDIELYQPTDEAQCPALASTLGNDGWLLAGGQDTFGWLKDRNKAPGAMIELTQIDAWKGIGRPPMALRLAQSRL